jgi:cytochrome bd-type quinol oxidase subunit 2
MKNHFNEFFSLILLVIGFILAGANFNIDATISRCTSKRLHVANHFILIIAVVLLMLTFGGALCRGKCDCNLVQYDYMIFYMCFLFIVGIAILVLSLIIDHETINNKSCKESSSKAWIKSMIITSSILISASGLYLGKEITSLILHNREN